MGKRSKLLVGFILYSSFCFAQQGNWLWASSGKNGSTGSGIGQNMIAADNSGNCFHVGYLSNESIHFGAYTLMENYINEFDTYLVKFGPNGNVLWAKQSQEKGNKADGNGYVVSTDGGGNAYIMASFSDTISFDSYMLTTQFEYGNYVEDNFLVKYDPNGNVLWAKQSQAPSLFSSARGNSLATDKKGNSYITGLFLDTVSFGAKTLIGLLNEPTSYTFLVKYDANGNVKWAKQSTGLSNSGSEGTCIAIDNKDGIFVSGWFSDSVTFGSYKLTSPPCLSNSYIAKYDTNGNVKWVRRSVIPSSHNFVQSRAITTDNFGNIYVAGLFWDTVVFANDTLITKKDNIFFVKYDSSGNVVWAKSPHVLDNNTWGATALSSDNKGDIFMSGQGGGPGICTICFGTDTLSVNDTSNIDIPSFVVKFDTGGNVLCASINLCGGNGNTWNGIASDTSGNYVYFGGVAETEGIFGKDTVYPYDNSSIEELPFVARWQECEPTLGVSELKEESEKVKVYPNPSNGQFTFDFSTPINGTIEIYDITGRKIYQQALKSDKTEISISNQPAGMYFYKAIANSGSLIGEGKVVVE